MTLPFHKHAAMNAHSARKSLHRRGLILTAAVGVVVACMMMLANRLPARADPPGPVSSLPTSSAGNESAPLLLVDHSAVNWDNLPVAPNPSPLSVAAYGD